MTSSQRLILFDSTLRDGTQGEGVALSCDDKLRIARRLDEFGVDYIEGGWPGSNPKDMEFFERAQHGGPEARPHHRLRLDRAPTPSRRMTRRCSC